MQTYVPADVRKNINMIFTANDPRAWHAQILDAEGNDLSKKYCIRTYDTGTEPAGIYEHEIIDGRRTLKLNNGLPIHKKIHLPGSRLVISEPLKKAGL
jgi:hypothetical protein